MSRGRRAWSKGMCLWWVLMGGMWLSSCGGRWEVGMFVSWGEGWERVMETKEAANGLVPLLGSVL